MAVTSEAVPASSVTTKTGSEDTSDPSTTVSSNRDYTFLEGNKMKNKSEIVVSGAASITSPINDAVIVAEYDNGTRVKDICTRYSLSGTLLYGILKKYGIAKRQPNKVLTKVDDGTIDSILADRRNGMSGANIMVKYNIGQSVLTGIVMTHDDNEVCDKLKFKRIRREQIVQLYQEGYSILSICENFAISWHRVYTILNTAGVYRIHDILNSALPDTEKRRRHHTITVEQINYVRASLAIGISVAHIARTIGIDYQFLNRYVRSGIV